jgi:hypothetical protein
MTYKIHQLLLDTSNTTESVIKVATSFKNVFAIRLLKSELYYIANKEGQGFYLYLNDYRQLVRREEHDSINIFARIMTGINEYSCVSTNILDDPYTYIFNPIEPKLNRFHIKAYEYDNIPKRDKDYTLVLHFAIFCYV